MSYDWSSKKKKKKKKKNFVHLISVDYFIIITLMLKAIIMMLKVIIMMLKHHEMMKYKHLEQENNARK